MKLSKLVSKRKLLISVSLGLSYLIYQNHQKEEIYYTYEDVLKHNTLEKGVWVTYKDKVYDITPFINMHPGGSQRIMLAAGKQIDPYWEVYVQHIKNSYVFENVLSPMKIGNLKDYDPDKTKDFKDPFMDEPSRDPALKIQTFRAFNAETPNEDIMDSYLTPNELFYVRNQFAVPNIDAKSHKITLKGAFLQPTEIDVDTIKSYPSHLVTSTLQCGGNRRGEYNKVRTTMGITWGFGAISTAQWKGTYLRDILKTYMKSKDQQEMLKTAAHVKVEATDGFKVSIPIEKALNNFGDVLLAYEMNGEDIPRDHGYPIRLIVPGYVGVRNIKWVKSIEISDEEMDSEWQRGISYKQLPPYVTDVKKFDLMRIPTILEQPIQSCIVKAEKEEDGSLCVEGFGYSGGGRKVIRVDVSCDGGKTWGFADLKEGNQQRLYRAWAWTFWSHRCQINGGKAQLVCKAVDSAHNVQPDGVDKIWNIRGLNNNAWHRVDFDLEEEQE